MHTVIKYHLSKYHLRNKKRLETFCHISKFKLPKIVPPSFILNFIISNKVTTLKKVK